MAFELPSRRGEAHPNSKLNNQERRACRAGYWTDGRTISDLARSYHVDRTAVRRIVHQPRDFLPDGSD